MRIISAIRKELLEVAHDRTMLAVLIAFPIFVMTFMGYSFRSMEINGLPVGLAGPENISESPLFADLNGSQAFKLVSYGSEWEAMRAFRNGQLRAVIIVPQDFEESLADGEGATVRIVVDNSDIALERSVLAALSSVIEASSTDITMAYVSSAWEELRGLNGSASALGGGLAQTRANMLETKESLGRIRDGIDGIDADSLQSSLEGASAGIASLKAELGAQKGELWEISEGNAELMDRTDAFLANASDAVNRSRLTVEGTHGRLGAQVVRMQETAAELDASIAGLGAIRAGSSDPVLNAALDLNIASLGSLRDGTEAQITEAEEQMSELESLNATLDSFDGELAGYSSALEAARAGQGRIGQLEAALDGVSARLDALDDSLVRASGEVSELQELLLQTKTATSQIDATLDDALMQTASVDALIGSLQETVEKQTGKDPGTIASPLSVRVESQYEKPSFVDFIMPQVIAVSLLFSCFLFGSISIVREKARKTIVRALMAPGALLALVVGKTAALVLLSFGQVAIILIVAALFFNVAPPQNPMMLLWGTAISSLTLTSIGVIIGFYARSESAAIQTCLLFAIPMLFLGNIIFSPDLLPAYTQLLQQLLPLAHVTSIFKIVLITNGDPAGDIAALLSYFVLLAVLMGYLVLRRRDVTDFI